MKILFFTICLLLCAYLLIDQPSLGSRTDSIISTTLLRDALLESSARDWESDVTEERSQVILDPVSNYLDMERSWSLGQSHEWYHIYRENMGCTARESDIDQDFGAQEVEEIPLSPQDRLVFCLDNLISGD